VRPGVLLRRAVASDVASLAALEGACFTHPWTTAQIADEVAGVEGGLVLVLEGRPVAGDPLAGIRAYGSFRRVVDELHVMNVAVAPGHRRQGLARLLLGFALGRAARAGAVRALLEVRSSNREALALYSALGFAPCGRRRDYYRDPVEDAVVLSLEGRGTPLTGRPGQPGPEP
jgi:[ribosomal protein S18]-alanine N-acetyltransferase